MLKHSFRNFIIFTVIVVLFTSGYYINAFITNRTIPEKSIIIESGLSNLEIGKTLHREGIVGQWLPFVLSSTISSRIYHQYIIPGEYHFSGDTSMQQVLERLIKGDRYIRRITIPEGYTLYQILKMINTSEGLMGSISVDIKEGELLPDTYFYFWGDSKNQIIAKMKQSMDDFLDKVFVTKPYLNDKRSLVTLASIIEKETGKAEERGRIAGVFLNRLQKNMLLQADPTVIYGITNGQTDYNYRLTKADLSKDTPYNTYLYVGLPPEPIACPGKEAIMAALNPVLSDDLYFVADGTGRHNFAKTLNTHNQNVSHYKRSRQLVRIKQSINNQLFK